MDPLSVNTSTSSPKTAKTPPFYTQADKNELITMLKSELPLLSPNKLNTNFSDKGSEDDTTNGIIEQRLEGALRKLLFDNSHFRGGTILPPLSRNPNSAGFKPFGENIANWTEQCEEGPEVSFASFDINCEIAI